VRCSVCCFANLLPEHHMNADSKDVVKLGIALIATMSALVLGLLIASAKGSYDAQSGEVSQMSANIIQLDRILTRHGSETKEARAPPVSRSFHYAKDGRDQKLESR
jgi:hypothetical protein